MCTVTIIPLGSAGYRLAANRDESRSRPAALPPRVMPFESAAGADRAVWPIDGQAGGTWIAATERGLALTLLNLNEGASTPPADELWSRGGVIPSVVRAVSERGRDRPLSAAAHAVERMSLDRFAPFRLVGVHAAGIFEAVWNGTTLTLGERNLGPACFASSGLGDRLVEPRLRLWREWLERYGATAEAQDSFHHHSWPERTEISVRMSRPEARTVSTTVIEVGAASGAMPAVLMRYRDDAAEHAVRLEREPATAVHERA